MYLIYQPKKYFYLQHFALPLLFSKLIKFFGKLFSNILSLFSFKIFSPISLNKYSIPIDSLAEVQLKIAPIFLAYCFPSFSSTS